VSAIQNEPSDDARARHARKAGQLVEANLAEARRSVWDLHPQYLDQGDIVAALSRMAADLGEHANVSIAVRPSGTLRPLSDEIEKNLFRIAQEAAANAIRHAAARQLTIALRFTRHDLQMTVSDDGRGFDPAATSNGFGLTSMRERAEQIGASFRVESRPLAGTSVVVTVPLARKREQPPLFSKKGDSRSFTAARTRRRLPCPRRHTCSPGQIAQIAVSVHTAASS
jgi:signal transduction histidine kinase